MRDKKRQQSEDTSSYRGQWRRDLQEGFGIEAWNEGARYQGTFRAGQKEGHGLTAGAESKTALPVWLSQVFNTVRCLMHGGHARHSYEKLGSGRVIIPMKK